MSEVPVTNGLLFKLPDHDGVIMIMFMSKFTYLRTGQITGTGSTTGTTLLLKFAIVSHTATGSVATSRLVEIFTRCRRSLHHDVATRGHEKAVAIRRLGVQGVDI